MAGNTCLWQRASDAAESSNFGDRSPSAQSGTGPSQIIFVNNKHLYFWIDLHLPFYSRQRTCTHAFWKLVIAGSLWCWPAVRVRGLLIVLRVITPTFALYVMCWAVAREHGRKFGALYFNDDYDLEIAALFDMKVTFGNRWRIAHFGVGELHADAGHICRWSFVTLAQVFQ